jgi:hypothetical protein
VAAVLVILAKPAGAVAAKASQIGTGPLTSSPEFNVRWRVEVTDEDRRRLEKELGLDNLGQVERDPRRRTWTYRLGSPSYPGLRMVLTSGSVEDTSLDAAQLERLRD